MGRLRGQPDWGAASARDFTGIGNSDLEQADRSNWVYSSSLTGELFFYDGFEAPVLHWIPDASTDQTYPRLVGLYANSGAQSVQLSPGPDDTNYSSISRIISVPTQPQIGVGCYFTYDSPGVIFEVDIYSELAGKAYDFAVRYNPVTGALEKYDDAGDWVSIGSFNWNGADGYGFVYLQLVVNVQTGKYVRFLIGNQTIELGGDAKVATVFNNDYVEPSFSAFGLGGSAGAAYVDDVIVTRGQQ